MAKRDALTLFEGIMIGIYGNWLISFLDEISLARAKTWVSIRVAVQK